MTQTEGDILRWYHPQVNPPVFQSEKEPVWKATDLELRRKVPRIGNQYHDVDSKLDSVAIHAHCALERIMLVKGLLPELVRDLDAERDDAGRAGSGKVDRWCEFHDQIFVAHFEAVLIQAKSLLDSLVQFYSIAFCRHIKSFSASKGNKGTDCGKNVISDLKSFSAADGTFSRAVTAAIRAHKTRWIDDTLLYRNEVVHFGQLRESYGHMLKLTPSPKHDPSDVAPPTLPNGQQTDAFITVIVHGAMEFSTEMMKAIFGKLQQTKPALLAEAAKKSRGK